MGHRIEYMYFDGETNKSDINNKIYDVVSNSGDGYGTSYIDFLSDICKTEDQAYSLINEKDKNGFYNGYAVRYYDTTKNKKSKKYNDIRNKITLTEDQKKSYFEETHIKNKTVNYITCPVCGSKLARKYLHSNKCPCCGNDLRSQKVINKINSFDLKINDLKKKMEDERAKSITKNTPIVWLVKYEFHE